ncbi:MAG: hypothetical protein ACREQ9_17530, partial [Candidatus Binatia bacterium]
MAAPPDSPRIVFVTHRFRHHTAGSGYDRIREWIPGETVDATALVRLTRPVPVRVFSRIRRIAGLTTYTRPRCLQEVRAVVPFLLRPRSVFFFLHADYGFRLLGVLPNPRGHRLVGTFHRPPAALEETILKPGPLARLDHAILLGETQRAFVARHVAASRISFIPHGVDTGYFRPDDSASRVRRCLFVGNYLRDFATFRETATLLVRKDPRLRVTVVARPHFRHEFRSLSGIE